MNLFKNCVNFAFLNQKVHIIANLFNRSKNQQSRDRNICENRIYNIINYFQSSIEISR